ncbi:IS21 family transposase [Alicyclobacillus cycloheptanicus]|uniref:Transposase n=1 Tax=Alicyclobacillus cycloheptanicus TaxID=1457 RepID=A0ABT9XMU6_9BACL|nr:IS21 family transposase [Alicyclobacillus cycloheptanicus]MDQ0191637.1 transposase [Alicyclobacillus cycloheptanicus]WDM00136.1 IS21 family transposase [Alicyclobacillus cycloheptanicus]WDM01858.1 IS21 family transposase [Alicyclobacillus cycloheptanicus]
MRKIKEVLRLHNEIQLSERAIARSVNLSRDTVSRILSRANELNLQWPLPEDIDDVKLESELFPRPQGRPKNCTEPDWNYIHKESRKKGVTLQLLWQEYKAEYASGYQYSQFCERYRQWKKTLQISMRGEHRAGEKMFVDYAGPTIPYIDRETGEILQAQLFVAVLGASNYTFAEAQPSQGLESFVGGHVRAFTFFGGVPQLLVPDNLKAGVKEADRYEPVLNPTYHEMASHYGAAVMPARPKKPKDKPHAEAGVLLVERWILAVLRNRKFFSLAEINQAIRPLLTQLNEKPFQKLEGSRKSLFENIDKPALRPLPSTPYEFAIWRTAKVNIDYHVEAEKAYYSVPYQLVGQKLEVRLTQKVVEIFHKGKRVASHHRLFIKGKHATDPTHMPEAHRKHLEWTPKRLIDWGRSVGPNTGTLVERILESRKHPEQGYRSCLGLLKLSKQYSKERMEAAALRALTIGAFSSRSVKSILQTHADQTVLPLDLPETVPVHENIRGADYYRGTPKHDEVIH